MLEQAQMRLDWLRSRADAGEIHTVRLAWTDRLGTWRGKRVPAAVFLDDADRRMGFCDGMIVVDVNCDVIQETPFSNFGTGYPDMYLRPWVETLAPIGWQPGEAFLHGRLEDHHGDPLAVAPANVLAAVTERLAEVGVGLKVQLTLAGRLMRSPTESASLLPGGLVRGEPSPGILRTAAEGLMASGVSVRFIDARADGRFRLALDTAAPGEAALAASMAKAALKESAAKSGHRAVFMSRLPDGGSAGLLEVELEVEGLGLGDGSGSLPARMRTVRALLQPSINAFKLGPSDVRSLMATSAGFRIAGLVAAAEADPATALAAIGACLGVGAGAAPVEEPGSLGAAATVLERSPWARDWLGTHFVDNSVPLLRHEEATFAAAVTDWEMDRYWSAG
jgi:glutamine synthetase